jgi:hypothetical protein
MYCALNWEPLQRKLYAREWPEWWISDPEICVWLMTSNSTLRTTKNFRDMVYYLYKGSCILFARPARCLSIWKLFCKSSQHVTNHSYSDCCRSVQLWHNFQRILPPLSYFMRSSWIPNCMIIETVYYTMLRVSLGVKCGKEIIVGSVSQGGVRKKIKDTGSVFFWLVACVCCRLTPNLEWGCTATCPTALATLSNHHTYKKNKATRGSFSAVVVPPW